MSADYSGNKLTKPPKPASLSPGHRLSVQNVEMNNRNQSVLRPTFRDEIKAGFQQSVSPVSQNSYSSDVGMTPMLQTTVEQDDRRQRRGSTKPSPSPVLSSQMDALRRENAELWHEIEELRADSERKQIAVEEMLNDVIKNEELLEESKVALSTKDAEMVSLRNEISRLTSEGHNSALDSLTPGGGRSRNHDGELRSLQLQCNRLKVEAERRDKQLREAHEQLRLTDVNQSRSAGYEQSQGEIQGLHHQLAGLSHQAQENHNRAESYLEQIHRWKDAYDSLKQSHSELVQAAQTREAQPQMDEQAAMRMKAYHASELRNALEISDFYKNNCAEVARKNNTMVAENMGLQKSLHELTRELEQQKSLIRTLQT